MFDFLKKAKNNAPPEPRIILGNRKAGGTPQPFFFTINEFRRNSLIRATSGSGKSYAILSILLQLLKYGESFSLIDPHGELGADLVKHLLDTGYFNRHDAFTKLIYIKWSRSDYFYPFNCLAQPHYNEYVLASYIHEAIGRAFPTDSATPLLSTVLVPTVVLLIKAGLPLTALVPVLSSPEWREELLSTYISDPLILDFFRNQFQDKPSNIQSTSRRMQLLTFSPTLRYSLGQKANIFALRALMDNGISMVHDFGGLDLECMRLLACLLTVFYEKAALSREDIDDEKRVSHHLVIDESPIVTTSSGTAFEVILEQTRKYKLFLKLIHQHMHQFDSSLHASLQQVPSEIALRQTEDDSKASAHRFSGITADYYDKRLEDPTLPSPAQLREQTAARLEELETGQAWVRVGRTVTPITTVRIPQPRATRAQVQEILDEYARRYAIPAADAKAAADEFIQPRRAETNPHDEPPQDAWFDELP